MGADKTAIDIVDEINDEAISAFDKGENDVNNTNYPSSIYSSIDRDLTEIKTFYEEVRSLPSYPALLLLLL